MNGVYHKKSADLIVLLRDFFFSQRKVSAADCVGMFLGVGGQTDARMRPHGIDETANHRPYRNPWPCAFCGCHYHVFILENSLGTECPRQLRKNGEPPNVEII